LALKQLFIQHTSLPLGGNIFTEKQFRFGCLLELRTFHCVDQMAAICGQATNKSTGPFHRRPCKWEKIVDSFDDIVVQADGVQQVVATLGPSDTSRPCARAQAGGRLLPDFATTLEVLAQVDEH
jgi:hypothetical protein